MNIRSITYFFNPGWPLDEPALTKAKEFITLARPAFEKAGYEVQTARLATPPFPHILPDQENGSLIDLALQMEGRSGFLGFDYVSLGPALPSRPASYERLPQVLAATKDIFLSGLMTTSGGGISLEAVRACARVIHQAAPLSADGFANLRFAALANVEPGAPFFPAAYHDGPRPYFALATESADLAVNAFTQAQGLNDARQRLISTLEEHGRALNAVAQQLSDNLDLSFGGIDFSLAPFPQADLSIGTALERLGVAATGLHGSLAAAAILADTIDKATFARTGFSGLMLPVLEDAILAARAAQGHLSLKDLLLYSAVCGTGLDTVPLPGDTTQDELATILLDLAALSQRLDKPLTARLMPIPGKKAGDTTGFDFAFFANSRVLAVQAAPLTGFLAGDETFSLQRRYPTQD